MKEKRFVKTYSQGSMEGVQIVFWDMQGDCLRC